MISDIVNKLPGSMLETEEKAPGDEIIDDNKTLRKSSWSFIVYASLLPCINNVVC